MGPAVVDTPSSFRTYLLLFTAGVNLILLQVLMIREFAIALFCTELMILIMTAAYFSGYSVGYFVSQRIPRTVIRPWLALVALCHLPLMPAVRVLSGWLDSLDLRELTIPLLVGVAALTLTSFYTVFLPRAIAGSGVSTRSLARCYSVELAGSATGLLLVVVLSAWWRFDAVATLYQGMLLVIAWCLGYPRAFRWMLGAACCAVLAVMPALDVFSTEFFYGHYFSWLRGVRSVHRVHSPYQKIEVLETPDGGRGLYLNGLEYFNNDDLEQFNFYLTEVPARLHPGGSALVVGSGSMSSLNHLAPHVGRITTVEIDRAVVEVGRRFFADYNRLDGLTVPWTLVIDDAKHFLSVTDQRFDLVIIDVPAPWYVQTGLLFTKEFYQLVKARLREGGVLSVYLTEPVSLDERRRVSSQILAALLEVFADCVVVNSRESPYGFAMAGDRLSFGPDQVDAAIRDAKPDAQCSVFSEEDIRTLIGDTPPASFDNLNIVWDLNLWALPYDVRRWGHGR